MPASLDEARTIVAALPAGMAESVKFVGLDIDVVRRFREGMPLEGRHGRAGDGIQIGSDGLLLARLDRIVPPEIEI
ncbi:MAG TPA: hypothetical protein VFR21_22800 [Bradyrhizobium sp.]|jgi:hypothetical protein|nr:hypothetical protein [Bradyrhizobium sp.]